MISCAVPFISKVVALAFEMALQTIYNMLIHLYMIMKRTINHPEVQCSLRRDCAPSHSSNETRPWTPSTASLDLEHPVAFGGSAPRASRRHARASVPISAPPIHGSPGPRCQHTRTAVPEGRHRPPLGRTRAFSTIGARLGPTLGENDASLDLNTTCEPPPPWG